MKRPRHLLTLLLAVLLLGAALTYSLSTNPDWQTFDFKKFLASLTGLDWTWLLLAVSAIYATYLVRALRWRILMRTVKADANLANLTSATVIGFGAVGVMGRAGELARPYLIARLENVSLSSQFAVWVVERCFDMFVLLSAVAFAVGQVDLSGRLAGSRAELWLHSTGWLTGVLCAGVLLLTLFLRRYYFHFTARLARFLEFLPEPRQKRIAETLALFGQGLDGIRETSSVFRCLLWSVVLWLLIGGAYYSVMASFPQAPRLTASQTLIFMGLLMAGSMLQIPGVGGGIQVAALLALTEVFHFPVELASGMAILLWALTFLVVIPPALALLAYNGLSWAKLRQLESGT